MFLRDHAPELLNELRADLALVTLFCSCEYLEEIAAFDEILVRMTLGALTQSRMSTIAIRGACGTLFNDRRQLLGIQLFVPGTQQLRVVQQASSGPYDLPVLPIKRSNPGGSAIGGGLLR